MPLTVIQVIHGCKFEDAFEPHARLFHLSSTVHTSSSIPVIQNSHFNSQCERGVAWTQSGRASCRRSWGNKDLECEQGLMKCWLLRTWLIIGGGGRKSCMVRRGRVAQGLPVFRSPRMWKSPTPDFGYKSPAPGEAWVGVFEENGEVGGGVPVPRALTGGEEEGRGRLTHAMLWKMMWISRQLLNTALFRPGLEISVLGSKLRLFRRLGRPSCQGWCGQS